MKSKFASAQAKLSSAANKYLPKDLIKNVQTTIAKKRSQLTGGGGGGE